MSNRSNPITACLLGAQLDDTSVADEISKALWSPPVDPALIRGASGVDRERRSRRKRGGHGNLLSMHLWTWPAGAVTVLGMGNLLSHRCLQKKDFHKAPQIPLESTTE